MSRGFDDDPDFREQGQTRNPFSAPRDISFGDAQSAECPPNYLSLAIFTNLCCCLPVGIAAVYFAAQVKPNFVHGDLAAAKELSDKARFWAFLGFGLGLLINALVFGVQFFVAFEEAQRGGGFQP
jgi:hypothetical protein